MSKILTSIGKGLAQFQDMVDGVLEKGFEKLKTIESDTDQTKELKTPTEHAKKIGKDMLSGVGKVGKAYYDEYERLKRKKR